MRCFNEAAANRCGSRRPGGESRRQDRASMRPQRIAADHQATVTAHARTLRASMRPQRIAADHYTYENIKRSGLSASMRPQRIAADHDGTWVNEWSVAGRFNEAAANRCGSHRWPDAKRQAWCRFNEAAANRCGSHYGRGYDDTGNRASMRPQRIAADHASSESEFIARSRASMRPQRIAADHVRQRKTPRFTTTRFNEAAANRCGSRSERRFSGGQRLRFNEAAANRCGSPAVSAEAYSPVRGFNEAAANRCGSPADQHQFVRAPHGFNEAAANRCGSPQSMAAYSESAPASMRPQRIAADHGCGLQVAGGDAGASMRPQRIAADHNNGLFTLSTMASCFNEAAANRCGSPA